MFDRGPQSPARLVAQAAPRLPVDRLCVGKTVDEVRTLVPRLFNLCREAQAGALDAALGFGPADPKAANREVVRDHLLKLFVTWPGLLGMGAQTFPVGWDAGGDALREALFGPGGQVPHTPDAFDQFLASDLPAAQVLTRIQAAFRKGEAVAEGLPAVDAVTAWTVAPVENSVAARHLDHPVMVHLEQSFGRGPLWRAAARIFDIEAALGGHLPGVHSAEAGQATASAARGLYAVTVDVQAGQVSAITRVTPTDHLLADGGMLDRALDSLPADKTGLGPLLLDILDPCSPVRLRGVKDA